MSSDVLDNSIRTSSARDSVSQAISAARIKDDVGRQITDQEVDRFIPSRFEIFEETQRKILEQIEKVERTFETFKEKFNLRQAGIRLVTSETSF